MAVDTFEEPEAEVGSQVINEEFQSTSPLKIKVKTPMRYGAIEVWMMDYKYRQKQNS